MSIFQWSIETKEGDEYRGEVNTFTGGEVRVVQKLKSGTYKKVSGEMHVPLSDDGRIFMNGYQSWTYVPERAPSDRIRGLMLMHQALVDRYSFDRYGDYHFVEYPYRKGVTHGFSYCYFREGEQYRLIASLDEHNGYTKFLYDATKQKLTIERDCKGLPCDTRSEGFHAFDLFFAIGTEDQVFDAWFQAMGVKPRTEKPLAGYSSWYNRTQKISQDVIREELSGAMRVLKQGDVIQIDDGWQHATGDWQPDEKKFPDGLKALVSEIHDMGFQASLWVAPFIAEKNSLIVREHPDWLLERRGKPWMAGGLWGGFYSLDIDNSDVREYLRRVFKHVFDEWGFDMVKLDYLYAGAPFRTETRSRAGQMISALEWLRELCGDHPILASGVPLMPAFGRVEYCRIGPDPSLDWDDKPFMKLAHRERPSSRHVIGNCITRRELDGRAFFSDPGVIFLRNDNLKMSEAQKVQMYEACAEYGGVLVTSDDVSKYDEKQIALYNDIRSAWKQKIDERQTGQA